MQPSAVLSRIIRIILPTRIWDICRGAFGAARAVLLGCPRSAQLSNVATFSSASANPYQSRAKQTAR
eukprot:3017189-Alexandrium_andersonii.AAC.1